MAGTQALDTSLLAVAAAAREQEKVAKRERARAMDCIIDLLLERAGMRKLLRECVPYLWTAPATFVAMAGDATMPKVLARRVQMLLDETPAEVVREVERSLQDSISQETADAAHPRT